MTPYAAAIVLPLMLALILVLCRLAWLNARKADVIAA